MPSSKVCPKCAVIVPIRLQLCKSCQHVFPAKTGKLQVVVKTYTTIEDLEDNIVVSDRNTLGSPFVCVSELSALKIIH